jgi:arylamine N-acetyltransferase
MKGFIMIATTISELSEPLTGKILSYLECPRTAPTLRYLNRLIYAYIRRVPWESVSRIVKRRATPETRDCPRLPDEFWNNALEHGFGGTCFESSLAFYSLLIALGYEGYLTVNDMGETRGCHAATTVLIGGQKYLVDVTIPVQVAVRIDPCQLTRRQTPVYDYSLHPVGGDVYEVKRSHNSKRASFTLIDVSVSLPDYQLIVQNDYLETGNFNRSVVINKVIDHTMTRFFGDHLPYKLEQHNKRGRRETLLPIEKLPRVLAETFHMPEGEIAEALSHVQAVQL